MIRSTARGVCEMAHKSHTLRPLTHWFIRLWRPGAGANSLAIPQGWLRTQARNYPAGNRLFLSTVAYTGFAG